ncbi:hypothetical protein HTZ77_20640 [Nonomuraea sp. SMC257]|uniref:Uncharacterized protein n=1 Tax=Nonomuraea montanisoli TaxID=2741721 RepID=A0A7Y6I8T5_9ACTN|nr:hypothetical protein [Nonomuraea montanisoli]NUW33822.1 hypothetical protein [Nonomuraea montanisoli]
MTEATSILARAADVGATAFDVARLALAVAGLLFALYVVVLGALVLAAQRRRR